MTNRHSNIRDPEAVIIPLLQEAINFAAWAQMVMKVHIEHEKTSKEAQDIIDVFIRNLEPILEAEIKHREEQLGSPDTKH